MVLVVLLFVYEYIIISVINFQLLVSKTLVFLLRFILCNDFLWKFVIFVKIIINMNYASLVIC